MVNWDRQNYLVKNCQMLQPDEVVLASYISIVKKYDLSICRIKKEPFFLNHVVFYFYKNHFLVKPVDQKISIFKSAGLIDYWISKYRPQKSNSVLTAKKSPKVMTLFDLSGVFLILIYCSTGCVIFFAMELAVDKCLRRIIFFIK